MDEAALRRRDAIDIVKGCACLAAHASASLESSVHAYEEQAQAIIAAELHRAAMMLEECPPPPIKSARAIARLHKEAGFFHGAVFPCHRQ